VYKANKLNEASFTNYNLNDYRVYLNAIALIGGVTAQGKYLQPEELPREYRLSAKEFSAQFNIDQSNAYRILKQAVEKLRKADIKVEKPDLKQTWYINVCEVVKYCESEGTIDIMFTGSIMEYIRQRHEGGNYTVYNLKEIAELTSFYAVRLYELVQQFSIGEGFIVRTVEEWREIFALKNDQYPLYANLKQKVFNQAMEEINLKTGYNLVMSETKEGRKVVAVKFTFNPDRVQEGIDTRTGKMTTRHRKPRAKKLTDEEITKLETKRAKQKEYRERHKAKKLAMQKHTLVNEATENAPEVHPDQQSLL
jgi:plasmid replication initiation protein